MEPFGIRITNVEPGPYSTNWLGRGSVTSEHNPAYAAIRETSEQEWEVGDAAATAAAVLELVDSADPPRRLLLGKSFEAIADLYTDRLHTWEEWQPTSLRAFGAP